MANESCEECGTPIVTVGSPEGKKLCFGCAEQRDYDMNDEIKARLAYEKQFWTDLCKAFCVPPRLLLGRETVTVPKSLLIECAILASSYEAVATRAPYAGRDPAREEPRDPAVAADLRRRIDEILEAARA